MARNRDALVQWPNDLQGSLVGTFTAPPGHINFRILNNNIITLISFLSMPSCVLLSVPGM